MINHCKIISILKEKVAILRLRGESRHTTLRLVHNLLIPKPNTTFEKRIKGKQGFGELKDYEYSESFNQNTYERILEKTGHYHGRGRYKYAGKKYEGMNYNKTIDTFAYFKEKGIQPRFDPVNSLIGILSDKTISLSKNRMYARCYSQTSNYKPLNFTYGNSQFWLNGYVALTSLGSLKTAFKKPITSLKKTRSFNKFLAHSRKPNHGGNIMKDWHIRRSDIEGNYGIIYGIKQGIPLANDNINNGFFIYEDRSINPITINDITHFEVPLIHKKGFEKDLKNKGIDLPVFATEDIEKYLSLNHTIHDLAKSHMFS